MSNESKEHARRKAREYVRSTKSFWWGPTTKKGDTVTDGKNTIVVEDVQWKKPVKLNGDCDYTLEYIDPELRLGPHAKQLNVSLTGGRPGRTAHVPANPRRSNPDYPSGP